MSFTRCISIFPLVVCFLTFLASCNRDPSGYAESGALPEDIDYNLHVQPILSDRCYRCHGPDANARKAELRLDTKTGLFDKSVSGNIPVKPGKVSRSEIIKRITSDDPDYMMPPPDSKILMEDMEIALLQKWIETGAQWKPHWAFITPERPSLPQIKNTDWPSNDIDYFILNKLGKAGLQPTEMADKETLLRRVTLDLTGLPPTIAQIDGFLADQSPGAYEKVVDRLLSSPHYGENMAVDWLDLARYADTHGYQADFYRPHWPWRDWVINAYNHNMPYDQFVTWQLAGDLLPEATTEQILATGFNRNHAQNNEGGIVDEEFRVEYVADRTQTFGTAFLGLTLQCARCHDHKYDPVSQQEFYQLFSFFNNVAESGQTTFYQPDMPGPTLLLPEEEVEAQLNYIEKLTREKQDELDQYREQQQIEFQPQLAELPGKINGIKGLVAHYPLEDAQNEYIANNLAGGKPGKIIDPVNSKLSENPLNQIEGKSGQGLQLTGDDALSFPVVGRFSRSDPFSIGLWVSIPQDLESGVIFHSNKGSALYTYKGYQVSVEKGHFDIRLAHNFPYNAIHLISEDPAPTEHWVHLMLTYDGSSSASGVALYLDGSKMAMKVERDNLYKDMVFYPKSGSDKPPVAQHLKVGARWRGKGFTNGGVDEITVFNRELTLPEVRVLSSGYDKDNRTSPQLDIDDEDLYQYYLANFDPQYNAILDTLMKLRKKQAAAAETIFEVMVMDEMAKPRTAHILQRGLYDQPADPVLPGTPASVMKFSAENKPDRVGLAQWLFHPDNPLPARVTVNRFWQHYFGTGLVKTADDFGSQGERPSHPELLDWLAVEFRESGWDIKHMQKLIVMSSAYKQSSTADKALFERDPENRLLARGPSNRLIAESLRDLVLSASGLLSTKIGGPSVKPYQPEGLWAYNAFSSSYDQDHGDDLYRRSLYTFWKRTNPPPSMNIFDAPSRSYCVVRREKTSTPLQALVLMNDPQFVEAARVLAQRIMADADDPMDEKIIAGFRLLTGRAPKTSELKLLMQQYQEGYQYSKANRSEAALIVSVGEFNKEKNLDINELSSLTKVMSTIMNLDATTIKR